MLQKSMQPERSAETAWEAERHRKNERLLKGVSIPCAETNGQIWKNEKTVRLIPKDLKNDLGVWRGAVKGTGAGLPISDPERGLALTSLVFVSDAAGAATSWFGGMLVD